MRTVRLRLESIAPLALLAWALAGGYPSARAACGGCDPCGGSAVGCVAPAWVRPSDAQLLRSGLLPLNRPVPAEPTAPNVFRPIDIPVESASLPPPVIVRSEYAAEPPLPSMLSVNPPPLPTLPDGWEDNLFVQTVQWRPATWSGTGVVRAEAMPGTPGGKPPVWRIRTVESGTDGSRPPAEKWGAVNTDSWPEGYTGVALDVFNGTRHPIHFALGVFVGAGRTYYESETRVLQPGWNHDLIFDGRQASWKAASVQWRFVASWVGTGRVEETAFLLYDAPDDQGVYIDRIRHRQ